MSGDIDLACVHVCQGFDVAQIFKGKLEAAGIPALLEYESAGPVIGITVDGLGEVRILVPAHLADDARSLLEELPESELEEDGTG